MTRTRFGFPLLEYWSNEFLGLLVELYLASCQLATHALFSWQLGIVLTNVIRQDIDLHIPLSTQVSYMDTWYE